MRAGRAQGSDGLICIYAPPIDLHLHPGPSSLLSFVLACQRSLSLSPSLPFPHLPSSQKSTLEATGGDHYTQVRLCLVERNGLRSVGTNLYGVCIRGRTGGEMPVQPGPA